MINLSFKAINSLKKCNIYNIYQIYCRDDNIFTNSTFFTSKSIFVFQTLAGYLSVSRALFLNSFLVAALCILDRAATDWVGGGMGILVESAVSSSCLVAHFHWHNNFVAIVVLLLLLLLSVVVQLIKRPTGGPPSAFPFPRVPTPSM